MMLMDLDQEHLDKRPRLTQSYKIMCPSSQINKISGLSLDRTSHQAAYEVALEQEEDHQWHNHADKGC